MAWDRTITHNDSDFEATLAYNLGKTSILNALLFFFFGTRLEDVSECTVVG